ncbi:MAG: LON peptidase substrate-binding domain-containing protein, partial [Treponema sp.]|nr:LON peptidase substrate-binding domain-containing protein [Treponema sp.]
MKKLESFKLGGLFSQLRGKNSSAYDYLGTEALITEDFPLLPLRDLVLFPQTVVPIFITYKPGIIALEEALKRDFRLFASCLKKNELRLSSDESYPIGTVARIISHLKLPDNTYRVVFQCEYRGTIISNNIQNNLNIVKIEPLKTIGLSEPLDTEDTGLVRSVQKSFSQYAEYSGKIGPDTLVAVEKSEDPERLANLVCNAANIKSEKKIELLAYTDTRERYLAILEILEKENEIFGIQKNISGKVRRKMDKRHREYILNEQLREINKELGKDKIEDEFAILEKRIAEKNPPKEVCERAEKEIKRLRKLQPLSPEAGVLRGYLEWIADLPWSNYSAESDNTDTNSILTEAEKILDEDHFGMQKAKDRIIEFIAVRQLLTNNNEQLTENKEQIIENNEQITEVENTVENSNNLPLPVNCSMP